MLINFSRKYFKPFINHIKSLQKRERRYNINSIFELMLRINVDSVRIRCEEVARSTKLADASSGNISYWMSQIYNVSNAHDMLFKPTVHKPPNCIAAVDGTCISIALKNKHGVSVGGATISSILDINSGAFIDYKVSYNLNENDALSQQLFQFTRNDLLIGDRNYGNYKLMKLMYNKVGFLFRIKSSNLIYKNLIKSSKSSMIVDHEGMKLKIIRYIVDRRTRKIIKAHWETNKINNSEDDLSIFVLCTNDICRSEAQLIDLYKQRWKIEPAFGSLKSNFDIRKPIRTNNCKNFKNMLNFKLALSYCMFNLARSMKNKVDQTKRKCRFTQCVAAIRTALCEQIHRHRYTSITKSYVDKIYRRIGRNPAPIMRETSQCYDRTNILYQKRRGRHKSVNTIIVENEMIPT